MPLKAILVHGDVPPEHMQRPGDLVVVVHAATASARMLGGSRSARLRSIQAAAAAAVFTRAASRKRRKLSRSRMLKHRWRADTPVTEGSAGSVRVERPVQGVRLPTPNVLAVTCTSVQGVTSPSLKAILGPSVREASGMGMGDVPA